jgi:glycerate kinase
MKVLIAMDKFKGSLTQTQATAAIEAGIKRVHPDAEIVRCPLADGGEGTVETIIAAAGGRIEEFEVCGPLPGMKVTAPIGFLPDGVTAIVELASASGMILLTPEQRDPTRTTTFGTGELLKFAAERGAKKIILGIGGSATNDAGLGLAQAWGGAVKMTNGKVYTAQDRKLCGNDLGKVLAVMKFGPTYSGYTYAKPGDDEKKALLDTRGVEFVVACDVGNPLFGPDGAAHVFAPQKGATLEQVEQLDADLRKLVERLQLPVTAQAPGAGAAGGAGFALMAFLGAKMVSGAELIIELSKLKEKIAGVDLVITGEGRMDGQTLAGKAPYSVARACLAANVPCIGLAGSIGPGAEGLLNEGMTSYFSIMPSPMALVDAMENAATLLEDTTSRVMRVMNLSRR